MDNKNKERFVKAEDESLEKDDFSGASYLEGTEDSGRER